jgi:hypothetical protein
MSLNPEMAPRLIDRYIKLTKMRKMARRHRKLRRFVRLVRSARVIDIGREHHALVMGLLAQAEVQIALLAQKKVSAVRQKPKPKRREVPTLPVMRQRKARKQLSGVAL